MKQPFRTHCVSKLLASVFLAALLLLSSLQLSAQIITTVAGNGSAGFSGDGGPATSAKLGSPYDVVKDGLGNLFITGNNRIRKMDTRGIITTIAGNDTLGFSGDGGPAIAARLNFPSGLALDAAGTIYFADQYNNRVRRIGTNGNITTVAGDGNFGYGGDGGPATAARFFTPFDVAVDTVGNLFIVDYNNRVRKVDTNGIITTVAGKGSPIFSGDGGPATAAGFNSTGVAVDALGTIFIVDQFNQRIRKVSRNGIITTVAGNGTTGFSGDGGLATLAGLHTPDGVAVDATGTIFISERDNNRIRKVSTDGIITTVAGTGDYSFSGDGGLATAASLNVPAGVTVDVSGNLFIADKGNQRIRKINGPYSVSISPDSPIAVCSGSSTILTSMAINIPSASYTWFNQTTGQTATGDTFTFEAPVVTAPSIYTIVVTATDGILSASATKLVTVYPTSSLSITANPSLTISQGQSTTLTASGANNYIWSTGATTPVIAVSAAGPYSVTGSVGFCSATLSTTLTAVDTSLFAIAGVAGLSCTAVSANRYAINFSPQYSGLNGQPISFSVVNELLPTSSPGPYSLQLYTDNPIITLKATQTGTEAEASYVYNWLSACNATVLPGSFAITGVTAVSCTAISANLRSLRFTPIYSGATGVPISFSVVNELLPTTNPGPYNLTLYTDNPTIILRAVQGGINTSFGYNWLAACPANSRIGAEEMTESLRVTVLGNPTAADEVTVEIDGAVGGLTLSLLDSRGHRVSEKTLAQPAGTVRMMVRLGRSGGIYLLRALTPTQSQVVKIVKE